MKRDIEICKHTKDIRVLLNTGTDYTGQSSKSESQGVMVDTTPPVLKNKTIAVGNRHLSSTTDVEAW